MAQRDEIAELRLRMERLETKVDDVRLFQRWLLGVAGGAGAIIAFLAQGIKTKLGIP